MYEDFKRRLREHIEEYGSLIPFEPTVAETYLIYALVLGLEDLEKEYDNFLCHCRFCSLREKKNEC